MLYKNNNDNKIGGGVPGNDDVCRSLLGLHRGLPLLVPRQVHAWVRGWDLVDRGWDLADGGWDLAESGWGLAESGWDLADCGWDLVDCGWDLVEWLERLTVNAVVATALGSIPASSDTVETEGRQMKQCWISYIKKIQKSPLKKIHANTKVQVVSDLLIKFTILSHEILHYYKRSLNLWFLTRL